MGRNAGTKVFFTYLYDGVDTYTSTWYCQQHGEWESGTNQGFLASHIVTDHGCEDL